MDLRNFFKKCFVENQHSIQSKKCEYIVEPYAEVDREQLSESSNNKKVQQCFFPGIRKNNFQKNKIKLEPQRNVNGRMIILCMGFIAQKQKC